MSDLPDNEQQNESTSQANSDEPKKKPDLDDTISRLLRRKVEADAEEAEGDSSE